VHLDAEAVTGAMTERLPQAGAGQGVAGSGVDREARLPRPDHADGPIVRLEHAA